MCVCVCVCVFVCVCPPPRLFSVTRQSATVTKVGVVYVNVHVSRRLKEGQAWVIDKRLWAISNEMLFKTVVPLRN